MKGKQIYRHSSLLENMLRQQVQISQQILQQVYAKLSMMHVTLLDMMNGLQSFIKKGSEDERNIAEMKLIQGLNIGKDFFPTMKMEYPELKKEIDSSLVYILKNLDDICRKFKSEELQFYLTYYSKLLKGEDLPSLTKDHLKEADSYSEEEEKEAVNRIMMMFAKMREEISSLDKKIADKKKQTAKSAEYEAVMEEHINDAMLDIKQELELKIKGSQAGTYKDALKEKKRYNEMIEKSKLTHKFKKMLKLS